MNTKAAPVFTAIIVALVSCFSLNAAEPAEKYVAPFNDGTKIYRNLVRKIGERPVFLVNRDERLRVLEEQERFFRVSDKNGNEGWVEAKVVKKIRVAKVYSFEDAKVMAYLDNPTPVYILDTDDPTKHLQLTRSFSAELLENIEREFIERLTGNIGYGERLVLLANDPHAGYLRY
jgi:hypothetical protein